MPRVNRRLLYSWRGAPLAFLCVLTLVLGQPSPNSLFLGSCLGLLGESLRFWAIGFTGGPTRGISLEAPQLISAGPYAYLRNPLYLGNILNGMAVSVAGWGHLPPLPAILVVTLFSMLLGAFYRTLISLEEDFLLTSFPNQFPAYRQAVPRLWPRMSAAGPQQGAFSLDRALFYEKSTLFWFLVVWTLLYLRSS